MPRVGQALPEIIHCVHCQWFHERSRCCSTGLLSDCLGCYPTDPPWRLPVDTHIDQPSLDLYQAHHLRPPGVPDLTINLAVVFGAASMAVLLAIAIVWILS